MGYSNSVHHCFWTFLLLANLPQIFVELFKEPYAKIQKSMLLKSPRTVVANFVPGNFGLFWLNPWAATRGT